MSHDTGVPVGKKRFSDFKKNSFLFINISVNQQYQHTIRHLILKLASNWLTHLKVIDLTGFRGTGRPCSIETFSAKLNGIYKGALNVC